MKIRRIMIAAPKSGSGKTTVTCGILQICKNYEEKVSACKCGPDYIDPMFHEKILDVPSKNLDTFFTGEEKTKELLLQGREENELVVMEGVMGLYDGLGGIREEGSSYHLAKVTDTPIVLIVDAKGMGRSILAVIAGFLAYDTAHLIGGIVLNRISKSYYTMLKPLIEEELPVKVMGYVPVEKEWEISSRHLGLVMPEEIPDMQKKMQKMAEKLEETVAVSEILKLADEAIDLIVEKSAGEMEKIEYGEEDFPVIAVAKDEAFCFYYEDNLNLLKKCGAKLRYFSPLHDETIPKECDGVLLGGGYPELYAKALSENDTMRNSVKQAFEKQMPLVAECGGFLYLQESVSDREGRTYPMAGVFHSRAYDAEKLVRFGYIEISEKESTFLPAGEYIRGHEFHYYDSTDNGTDCTALKPVTKKRYDCMREGKDYFCGFPHLYYPSNPKFAEIFVQKAAAYRKRRNGL